MLRPNISFEQITGARERIALGEPIILGPAVTVCRKRNISWTRYVPTRKTLLVLDLEANPQGPQMNLEEARAFVTHRREVTGRWPGLYSGHYVKDLLGTSLGPVRALWGVPAPVQPV